MSELKQVFYLKVYGDRVDPKEVEDTLNQLYMFEPARFIVYASKNDEP
jgi:hypothetical protein